MPGPRAAAPDDMLDLLALASFTSSGMYGVGPPKLMEDAEFNEFLIRFDSEL